MPTTNTNEIADRLRERAAEAGFALCGIAPAIEADGFAAFRVWLDAGHAGEMTYLSTNPETRRHPSSILPEVRSVVMLGMEYHSERETPDSRIARYACHEDYHDRIRVELNRLSAFLSEAVPGSRSRGVVDTAPLLERDFARRAGLGWIGRNTMLISPTRGSWFLLAALLTDLELPTDEPFARNHCGTCTACLQACPTQAFVGPGILDARKCIAYLTIELKSPMPEELRPHLTDWIFGCDVCQEVCPWNNRPTSTGPLLRRSDIEALTPTELLTMTDASFRERFRGTPLFRTKRRGLARNAAIVLGNVGSAEDLPLLRRLAADEGEDEVVREACGWAAERIALKPILLLPSLEGRE